MVSILLNSELLHWVHEMYRLSFTKSRRVMCLAGLDMLIFEAGDNIICREY